MKRDPVNGEPEQNGWLAGTLRQSRAAGEGCLDAETLAAWSDGGLSTQAAAAVELHASTCPRCTAMLAAIERTAPAAPVRHAWPPARLFRWLVPVTAAATAVAIWIAVPDRPVTPVPSAPARDLQATRERTDAGVTAEPQVPVPVPVPEPRTLNQNPAPSTQNVEPQGAPQAAPRAAAEPQQEMQLRREFSPEPETPGAAPPVAPVAPPPPPAPAPFAQPSVSADAVAETAGAARRSTLEKTTVTSDSASISDPQVRWRVVNFASIERSRDGGKTWAKTSPLPRDSVRGLTIVGIRAKDGSQAIARMSDGSEFYTSNGGMSWLRLQENSPAPF